MDVLLQVLAAPVVLVGMLIDWVYSIGVIASNFFSWVFMVVEWFMGVLGGVFGALFNPVSVSVSEMLSIVGDSVSGDGFKQVLSIVDGMYGVVPDSVWLSIMSMVGVGIVWRVLFSEKGSTD